MENKILEVVRAQTPPLPIVFSPFIVTSRGKKGKKEQRDKILNNSLGSETPTKETVMQLLNTSQEDTQKTVQYYKFLLNREIKGLEDLCAKWEDIQKQEASEDGIFIINQAIGQSRLLIEKKFKRFRGLVLACESNDSELLVGSQDLQGFWEMMQPEIRNCHERFEKLEKLKENNWIEEELVVEDKPVAKKRKIAAKPKVVGKSNIRAFIEAQRKKKVQEDQVLTEDSTPKETRVLRNRVAKTPEVLLDSSIVYINSDQTPGKSILKKIDESRTGGAKSVNKVNFKVNLVKDDAGKVEKQMKFDEDVPEVREESTSVDKSDKDHQKAVKEIAMSIFGNRRKRNRGMVLDLVKGDKLKGVGEVEEVGKEEKRILRSQSIDIKTSESKRRNSRTKNKENCATTPRRRSARKSIRLNMSDECTVCPTPGR